MSSELKPCPFCGGEATSVDNGVYESWFVVCLECDTTTGYYDTDDEAIAVWNQRAEPAYKAGYKDGYQMGRSEVRTCKDVSKPGVFFECSECGAIDVTGGTGNYTLEYCPACGAKVVE